MRRLDWTSSVPFLLIHLAVLLTPWTGVSWPALAACVTTYVVRMFAITGGFHRYFSHRTYKTGRVFQFLLAWVGTSAVQKGVLWWAANHRHHHAHSDTEFDTHSPVVEGFWWSHLGWFLCNEFDATREDLIPDLMRYPELRFLNRWYVLPPVVLGLSLLGLGAALHRWYPATGATAGQMLVWGFFVSTVVLYHATFAVNSLAHLFGTRRFATRDNSRNNPLIAAFTLGEGWHNNHHYSPSLEKHGVAWWEIDCTHYALRALSYCGVVWDLRVGAARSEK
jgi:stearoyl-CoA desaturase (delta-9 desaturase)